MVNNYDESFANAWNNKDSVNLNKLLDDGFLFSGCMGCFTRLLLSKQSNDYFYEAPPKVMLKVLSREQVHIVLYNVHVNTQPSTPLSKPFLNLWSIFLHHNPFQRSHLNQIFPCLNILKTYEQYFGFYSRS